MPGSPAGRASEQFPAFIDDQDLVHRAVYHPVAEKQHHRYCGGTEYEYQPGAERMVLSGFRQAGEIFKYVLYVHHISYNHLLTVAFTVASIASFSRKENITMSVIDQGRCCT